MTDCNCPPSRDTRLNRNLACRAETSRSAQFASEMKMELSIPSKGRKSLCWPLTWLVRLGRAQQFLRPRRDGVTTGLRKQVSLGLFWERRVQPLLGLWLQGPQRAASGRTTAYPRPGQIWF